MPGRHVFCDAGHRRAEATPPDVSLLTPTYNRASFLGLLAELIHEQDFPLRRCEWIIVDDSTDRAAEEDAALTRWFRSLPLRHRLHRLLYVRLRRHITIGRKRNICKALSRGRYCIHMDDDDFYASSYVSTVVGLFKSNPTVRVVGATSIYFIYPDTPYLWLSGPFHRNHTCGGAMSYTREYASEAFFDNDATRAEERYFLRKYQEPVLQIQKSYEIYLALAHGANTVDKHHMKRSATSLLWPGCVAPVNGRGTVALYTYLRMYRKHAPLLGAPLHRSHMHMHDTTVWQMNRWSVTVLRLHVVHILVNIIQVGWRALANIVAGARGVPHIPPIPIFPKHLQDPWHSRKHRVLEGEITVDVSEEYTIIGEIDRAGLEDVMSS